jgi:hypothetical protein
MEDNLQAANVGAENVTASEGIANPNETPIETTQTEVQANETVTQTQAFAHRLKEETARAKDAVIAEMYGTQGITTYAQYQKALADQKAAEEAQKIGIDPDFYQRFSQLEQKLNLTEHEKVLMKQEHDLESDPKTGELFKQWKDEVKDYAQRANCDYDVAFTIISRNKLPELIASQVQKGEQEALKKINANAASSPGPLSADGVTVPPLTEEAIEGMTDRERMARWPEIKKFYNMK